MKVTNFRPISRMPRLGQKLKNIAARTAVVSTCILTGACGEENVMDPLHVNLTTFRGIGRSTEYAQLCRESGGTVSSYTFGSHSVGTTLYCKFIEKWNSANENEKRELIESLNAKFAHKGQRTYSLEEVTELLKEPEQMTVDLLNLAAQFQGLTSDDRSSIHSELSDGPLKEFFTEENPDS